MQVFLRRLYHLAGWMSAILFTGMLQGAEAPQLTVGNTAAGQIDISWVVEAGTEYRLESSANLSAWSDEPTSTVVEGTKRTVTVSATDSRRFYRLREGAAPPPFIAETSPAAGERGVSLTREVIVRLSAPLDPSLILDANAFYAGAGGRRILSRTIIGDSRETLTLFFLETVPAGTFVTVTVDGNLLRTQGGVLLDADGDAKPGGMGVFGYETSSIQPFANTAVVGRVFASEKTDSGTNRPLANVTITVDGAEETLRATTDATGFFQLSPAPAGRFFVHVDGRTATGSSWPNGDYYPFVGKAWEALVGRTNVAGGTGEIYLPLIPADSLTLTSSDAPTVVKFSAGTVATNPALAGVEIVVPPNSLFADNGGRGGRVGIAAVPPDRLPEPLPMGLNLPVVITIQTDGAQNFALPVPVKFPNLPDPTTGRKLSPGAKTVLWSFNHDTGRWESQGTATISADGNFAVSDPGVGVRQPGWHGVMPGTSSAGPRPPNGPGAPSWPNTPPNSGNPPQPCTGDDCDCTQTILCKITTEGKFSALCALDCLGNVVEDLFGKGEKAERTAFETGLHCIGGPDTCPGNPEPSLTPQRRKCMNECTHPLPKYVSYTMPCEGFISPCPDQGAAAARRARPAGDVAFADLLPDRFEEQNRFWEVEGEFYVALTGTSKIANLGDEDAPKISALFEALRQRVQPGSPAGIHLSAAERAELVALERPSNFSATEWATMIDRLDAIQGAPPADVIRADEKLQSLVVELKSRGWKHRAQGALDGLTRLARQLAPRPGTELFPVRAHHFYIKDYNSGLVWRGKLSSAGLFDPVILSPEGYYMVAYLDPVTLRVGVAFFAGAKVGQVTTIPTAALEPGSEVGPDDDGDGLPNVSELILGTNPAKADTDGDGINDGAEMKSGGNPLDNIPVASGLIAAMSLPGHAVDVVAMGGHAYVALLDGRLAVAELRGTENPVLTTMLPVQSGASALSGAGSTLAVIRGASGMAIVNVSNPAAPAVVWSGAFESPVSGVGVRGDEVFAGLRNGKIVVLNAATGAETRRLEWNRGVVSAFRFEGSWMYALTTTHLGVFAQMGSGWTFASDLQVSNSDQTPASRAIMIENGVAWVGFESGFTVGMVTIDLSNPLALSVIGRPSNRQPVVHGVASVGNRTLLSLISARNGQKTLSIYGTEQPTNVTRLIASLPRASQPEAFTLHGGYAWVAAGPAGLQVYNFQSPDFAGIPPSVSLTVAYPSGIARRAEYGALLPVTLVAQDDIGVRSIDLAVDGVVVQTVGATPGQLAIRLPAKSEGKTSVTLRARATDLSANIGFSADEVIQLVEDASAPFPRKLDPYPGGLYLKDVIREVSAEMSEPVVSPLPENALTVQWSGADGILGTGDDVQVAGTASYDSAARRVVFTAVDPLPGGKCEATLSAGLLDAAGNPSREARWTFVSTNQPKLVEGVPFPESYWVTVGVPLHQVRLTFDAIFPVGTAETQTWMCDRWDLEDGSPGPPIESVRLQATLSSDRSTIQLRRPGGFITGRYAIRATGPFVEGFGYRFSFRDLPNEWRLIDNVPAWKYGGSRGSPGSTDAFIVDAPGNGPSFVPRELAYVLARSPLTINNLSEFDIPGGLVSTAPLQFAAQTIRSGAIEARGPLTLRSTVTLLGGSIDAYAGGIVTGTLDLTAGLFRNHPGSSLVFSNATVTSGTNALILNQGQVDITEGRWNTERFRNEGVLTLSPRPVTIKNLENRGEVRVASNSKVVFTGRLTHSETAGLIGAGGAEFAGTASLPATGDIRGAYDLAGPLVVTQGEVTFWRPLNSLSNLVATSSRLRLLSPSSLPAVTLNSSVLYVNTSAEIQSISNSVDVEVAGLLKIQRGLNLRNIEAAGQGTVEFAGSTLMANGTQPIMVGIADAIVRNSGQFLVGASGVNGFQFWNRRGANGPGVGRFENVGVVEMTTDRPMDLNTRFVNAGELKLRKGTLIVQRQDSGGGTGAYGVFTQTATGILTLQDTEVNHDRGGTLDLGNGTVRGVGTFRVENTTVRPRVISRGILQPGTPMGAIAIRATDGLELAATSELRVVVTPSGSGRLQVSGGRVRLAGRLRVELQDGFVPEIGAAYAPINFNQSEGEFSEVILPSLPAGRKWQVEKGPFSINLRVVSE